MIRLESHLQEVEKALADNHTDCLLKQVLIEIPINSSDLYNKKVEYAMFRLKSNCYESGD